MSTLNYMISSYWELKAWHDKDGRTWVGIAHDSSCLDAIQAMTMEKTLDIEFSIPNAPLVCGDSFENALDELIGQLDSIPHTRLSDWEKQAQDWLDGWRA